MTPQSECDKMNGKKWPYNIVNLWFQLHLVISDARIREKDSEKFCLEHDRVLFYNSQSIIMQAN